MEESVITELRSYIDRLKEELAEAKRQLTEVTDQMGDAIMQRDIMSHLFNGGEVTDEIKADAIKCGLGESVFIDQKHEVARLEKELWRVNMECARAYGERNDGIQMEGESKAMTQQQKNIKICEALGWRIESGGIGTINVYEPGAKLPRRCSLNIENAIPNHFADLNACHEMEKLIMDESSIIYYDHLSRLSCPWHATAAQRAEAFGKTLNLW